MECHHGPEARKLGLQASGQAHQNNQVHTYGTKGSLFREESKWGINQDLCGPGPHDSSGDQGEVASAHHVAVGL